MQIDYKLIRDGGDGEFDIEAYLAGVRIGWARCVQDGNRLLLADIQVLDEMPISRRGFGSLRHQGIGSELLRRVLLMADSSGIPEIWGSVMRKDLDRQPTLLAWYERYGFQICDPDDECVTGSTKKIVRRR